MNRTVLIIALTSNCLSLVCPECYDSKEKHKNHRVSYITNHLNASCDCGCFDAFHPSGFFSKHKGLLNTEEEISQLLSASFTALKAIRVTLDLLGWTMNAIMLEDPASPLVNVFFEFIIEICEANPASFT